MGGVKGREITRNQIGMYVWGVAVRTGRFVRFVLSIYIDRYCVFALFALFVCLVLPTRCCAADLKAHHTVRATFLSMHADGDGDGDCLLLL